MKIYKNSHLSEETEEFILYVELKFVGFVIWMSFALIIGFILGKLL